MIECNGTDRATIERATQEREREKERESGRLFE